MSRNTYQNQAWKIQEQEQARRSAEYRAAASGEAIPGKAGEMARRELSALDAILTQRAEKALAQGGASIARPIVYAMDEHQLSSEERVALVKQLLKPSHLAAEFYPPKMQQEIFKRVLQARANNNIAEMSHAGLKTLIDYDILRLREAGRAYCGYMNALGRSHSEAARYVAEFTEKWVCDSVHNENMEGYRSLYRSGKYEAVGTHLCSQFFNEIDLPRIDAHIAANPRSRIVYGSRELAQRAADAIGREMERNPEYAQAAFGDQIRGLREFAQRDSAAAAAAMNKARAAGRLTPVEEKRCQSRIDGWQERLKKLHHPALPGEEHHPSSQPEAPCTGLTEVARMQDHFRSFYYAHRRHSGGGRNSLLVSVQGLATDDIQKILASAANYDRQQIFRESLFGKDGREQGLALFDRYQQTLQAELSKRSLQTAPEKRGVLPDFSPKALAHTFLENRNGFEGFLRQYCPGEEALNEALNRVQEWKLTAAADKADALKQFEQQLAACRASRGRADSVIG